MNKLPKKVFKFIELAKFCRVLDSKQDLFSKIKINAGLNKHVGEQFYKKSINVQALNKSMQVGIF